jgi:lysyl-tRNA synthetase class 2
MSWEPQVNKHALEIRANVNQQVRKFFLARNVLEVETPILKQYAVTDLHIDSILTEDHKFLHTSPEYAMKRLLAYHKCDVYQLCKAFRANEVGNLHSIEFTMLEWYRVAWSYKDLMKEVAELVTALVATACNGVQLEAPSYISYQEIFRKYSGIDVSIADQADYLQVFSDFSIELSSALSVQEYQELVLDQIIVPKLDKRCLTFVYDFPAEFAALARLNAQGFAERFELYFGGLELANGFQELTDAQEQRLRFEEDNRKRLLANKKAVELDEQFIAALKAGLPESAGVALGIDRLLMIILNTRDIKDVLSFALT